jgi:hypothetical protein
VRPREADELGGVVLVLDVVRVRVGVEPLDDGQYPRPVLVGPRDLGRDLLPGPRAELGPVPLPDRERRGAAVKVRRRSLVVRDDAHVVPAPARQRPPAVAPRSLEPLQEPPDALLLVGVHPLKVPGDGDRQLAGRGVRPDGDACASQG